MAPSLHMVTMRDGVHLATDLWTAGWWDRYSQAACVHMSSWFDPYALTAMQNYAGLKRAGRGRQLPL